MRTSTTRPPTKLTSTIVFLRAGLGARPCERCASAPGGRIPFRCVYAFRAGLTFRCAYAFRAGLPARFVCAPGAGLTLRQGKAARQLALLPAAQPDDQLAPGERRKLCGDGTQQQIVRDGAQAFGAGAVRCGVQHGFARERAVFQLCVMVQISQDLDGGAPGIIGQLGLCFVAGCVVYD